MSANWRIIVDGPRTAASHMATDVWLAQDETPTLRLFTWSPPAMSLGLRQPLPAWLNLHRWTAQGLEVVERPTGGGIAFHGSDVSLAAVLPRCISLSLATVMGAICHATAELCQGYGAGTRAILETPGPRERITYCLTEPSAYAVLVGGRKMAGFAIRRYPKAWLIQGSLLVQPIPAALAEALPPSVRESLASRAIALSEAVSRHRLDVRSVASQWASGWAAWWDAALLEELVQVN